MAKKKKEWAHLRGKYPQATTQDAGAETKFADLVALERQTLKGKKATELMAEWNDLDAQKTALEQQVSALNIGITAREREVFAFMEANDIEDMTIGDGYFTRTTDPSVKQDKRRVLAWALEHMPDIVSVNAATLTAQVKDALRKGTPFPDGVEVELRDRISRKSA